MSRNLGTTNCYHCGCKVTLLEPARKITKTEARSYYDEYAGMLVANAECPDCKAKYLAWLDNSPGCKRAGIFASKVAVGEVHDLSYRSTFDDEPKEEDLPEYLIQVTTILSRKPYEGKHAVDNVVIREWEVEEEHRHALRTVK